MFLINPFTFAAAGGNFEPIATVTVGSGGASSIEFTSIPGTYQHLQVRVIARTTTSGDPGMSAQFNSDTGTNYASHLISGNGTAASAGGGGSLAYLNVGAFTGSSELASTWAATVLDILDYASTSKNTTTRSLTGKDLNGSGYVRLFSGAWFNTSAVTSIKLYDTSGRSFAEHSTAALYGVKV